MVNLATANCELSRPAMFVQAMVGHHYRTDDFYEVGREKIREFATVVRDRHPAHRTEAGARALGFERLLAPLTFASAVGMKAQQRLLEEIAVGFDLSQLVQTDQHFRFHQPIVAGDRLGCDVSLDAFEQVRGRNMLQIKNVVCNQRGEAVLTSTVTLFVGDGETGRDAAEMARGILAHDMSDVVPERGAADRPAEQTRTPRLSGFGSATPRPRQQLHSRPIAEVAAGDELPGATVVLRRGDLVSYAGATGDGNPIHWNAEFAQMVGLETVVAHGMLTMGIIAGYLTNWLGDPTAVDEFSVRFARPVYVDLREGATLELSGAVQTLDRSAGTATIAVNARCGGRRIFGPKTSAAVRLTCN
ncbi:MAG: MaoC family dehydratase N-terminal domain-containing protein [Nocardia sp.]|nr:MaoC family dehydratase N-terminal domain-containing protein [Nocardia sp.]